MNLRHIFTVGFLLLLIISSTMAQAQFVDDVNIDINLGYRDQSSYFINGQRQDIILDLPWGAVVYQPKQGEQIQVSSNFSQSVLKTPKGDVTISFARGKGVDITYPEGAIEVSGSSNGGSINFKGQTFNIDLNSRNRMTIHIPGDDITYETGAGWISISGNKGTVKYQKNSDGFSISGDAGTTTYKVQLDGSYTMEGSPLNSYPYGYWGTEFFLQEYGVGVIVEFNRLINFPGLPDQIKLKKAIVIK